MKLISWTLRELKKLLLLEMTFSQSDLEFRWRVTHISSHMKKLFHTDAREFWRMPCALGADLSQGDDFCAFTFLFPLVREKFGVKTRSYITELTLMKLPGAMRQKYEEFIKKEVFM